MQAHTHTENTTENVLYSQKTKVFRHHHLPDHDCEVFQNPLRISDSLLPQPQGHLNDNSNHQPTGQYCRQNTGKLNYLQPYQVCLSKS